MHPSSLEDPTTALEHELDSKIMTYDEAAGGVVLSYDQVRVEEPCGRARMFQDSHYIHFHVSARLLLFAPKVGSKLVGEVNFISNSSIGLLVHGVFNASIIDENIPDDWDCGEDEEDNVIWQNNDDEELKMEIGTLVSFGVTEVNHAEDVVSIQGTLIGDKYGVVGKAEVPIAERHRLDASATVPVVTPVRKENAVNTASAQKKEKEKKRRHGEMEDDDEGMNGEASQGGEATPNGEPGTPGSSAKKQKKAKKEKKEKSAKKKKKKEKKEKKGKKEDSDSED